MKDRAPVGFLIVFLFWMTIGFIHSLQNYFYNFEPHPDCNIISYFGYSIPEYLLWAFYTLLIFMLVRRFPFEQLTWWKAVSVHLLFSVLVTLFHLAAISSIRWGFYKITGQNTMLGPYTLFLTESSLGSFFLPFVFYFITAIAGYALDYYNKYRKNELERMNLEKLLVNARLEGIKNHLHPHFLFNTLNTISMLVRKQDNQKAVDVIASLGDLLRYMLENRENNWTTLGKEEEVIQLYLSIEQIRFQNRLEYTVDIPEELKNIKVPDLLLQPLVENAFKHGLKDKTEKGTIKITAFQYGNELYLTVCDNGKGFDIQEVEEGFGLKSTKERLEKLYSTRAHFEIDSKPGEGTRINIRLPIR
jgi:sensor histidine kinase YesM